jgi:hypothetical protein
VSSLLWPGYALHTVPHTQPNSLRDSPEVARLYREGKLDPHTPETHAGKFVSAGIRMLREREQPAEQEQAPPHEEIAACTQVVEQLDKSPVARITR